MGWRGAWLSGDSKRKHSIAWSIASVLIFLVALLFGAMGNHDSVEAVREANSRATASDNKLSKIQGSISDVDAQNIHLLEAINRIATEARVDPNQSAQSLADQVITKLTALQQDWEKAKDRISKLENPPPDPDHLYQGRAPVAKFWSGNYFPTENQYIFFEISDANGIDFANSVFFRGLELRCSAHNIDIGSYAGPHGMIHNVMNNVNCHVVSGTIEEVQTNPQSLPPPTPAPQSQPEKK